MNSHEKKLQKALLVIQKLEKALEDTRRLNDEPVAVVGMGCRFPGGCENPDKFWSLLADGVDASSAIPASRFDTQQFYDPRPDIPGKMYTRRGAFLGIPADGFDSKLFRIPEKELEYLDPQQRLLLEVSWRR